MATPATDFLVIGGGVVGLTLAMEARRRHPGARVTLLEKEEACGLHASGRNSGVLHAGFYYTADSLKARFTREGQRRWSEYCEERGLRINRCGKLVVARSGAEHAGLDELLRRARANGVELHDVTEKEARELEPRARTVERALWSPSTASVDPAEVMASLVRDARAAGVEIRPGTRYLGRTPDGVLTSTGTVPAGYVINAAGLYADRIARDYGFSADYRILPFRGLYLYADAGRGFFRRHVYPVPELRHPFLGVHFTVTVDGRAKIGPTALPALWREHYGGLGGFRWDEFMEVGLRVAGLLRADDFEFRSLARRELPKAWKRALVRLASELAAEPVSGLGWRWGKPGIRAQLVNVRERKLEMDFRYEGDGRSFHVLNAVSPAFTCALPFAEHVFDQIDRRLRGATAVGAGLALQTTAQS
ncbi:MAG TPA: FAD-dependent oxidoreductase [Longimicrobiaceae bacterium]|nr:FAD-dependent oxidoreductase [Longimicrobiaceae bacterium]